MLPCASSSPAASAERSSPIAHRGSASSALERLRVLLRVGDRVILAERLLGIPSRTRGIENPWPRPAERPRQRGGVETVGKGGSARDGGRQGERERPLAGWLVAFIAMQMASTPRAWREREGEWGRAAAGGRAGGGGDRQARRAGGRGEEGENRREKETERFGSKRDGDQRRCCCCCCCCCRR
jgi:hypothetical protein